MADWHVEYRRGTPRELVESPAASRRTVLVAEPSLEAVVLGSAQRVEDFEPAALAGGDVVRRHSGGGAVLVGPDAQVWVDVFVPADDPLARLDVNEASHWLGEAWVRALCAAGGEAPYAVHRDGLCATPWSRLICFAAIGPGEVVLEGRKVVGISQRRSRAGAWLYSMAPTSFDAERHAALVALGDEDRRALAGHLAAGVLPVAIDPATLLRALLDELPR